ncbi:MAG TPA: ATP-binding cassette domain-containing protein [Candidatus Woesebacteria bacterium]|nr:ATP-binding cassette domain-containing protein [Candidatus Woesebacteria bacterium]HPJ16907.1 ATP-binding cassette domain-containing protein [Candidatus Woesebacteria bacterium]
MLEVTEISKYFGDIKAVDNVNLKISKGSVVGLLGPNGAGKTTLMRIIVGFYQSNTGKIKWNGKLVKTKSRKHRQRIGYLPENNPLYLSMTVGEYLSFVAELKGVDDLDNIKKVIRKCGLADFGNKSIETLSKGYRQRVGLAAALLGNPEIIILDEPTTGLDPNQIIEIRNLIKQLAKDRVLIFSTHILPEAREICERIIIINKGKIVLDEKTKEIKDLEKKFIDLTS